MEVDRNGFRGFEQGTMTFSVDWKRTTYDMVWLRGEKEAWRFLASSNTEMWALLPSGRVQVMRSNGELTVSGKKLLWALMDPYVHRALELLERK